MQEQDVKELVDHYLTMGKITEQQQQQMLQLIQADGVVDEQESDQLSRLFSLIEQGKIKVVSEALLNEQQTREQAERERQKIQQSAEQRHQLAIRSKIQSAANARQMSHEQYNSVLELIHKDGGTMEPGRAEALAELHGLIQDGTIRLEKKRPSQQPVAPTPPPRPVAVRDEFDEAFGNGGTQHPSSSGGATAAFSAAYGNTSPRRQTDEDASSYAKLFQSAGSNSSTTEKTQASAPSPRANEQNDGQVTASSEPERHPTSSYDRHERYGANDSGAFRAPAAPEQGFGAQVRGSAHETPFGNFIDARQGERRGEGIFTLETDRFLNAQITEGIWTKTGAMVAYTGNVRFTREGIFEHGATKVIKRAITSEGALLTKAMGHGTLYLADKGKKISLVSLNGDTVIVKGSALLAFESSVKWDIVMLKSAASILSGGFFNVRLNGFGSLAITTHFDPILLRVSEGDPVRTDPQATIAWSGSLAPALKTDISAQTFIGRTSGETVQMEFAGAGFVLVQPYEEPLFDKEEE